MLGVWRSHRVAVGLVFCLFWCDLCYVDAQTSGFVGLGINAFPGLCVHYFCVPCCVCWYEHSLKSNKPLESCGTGSLERVEIRLFSCTCSIISAETKWLTWDWILHTMKSTKYTSLQLQMFAFLFCFVLVGGGGGGIYPQKQNDGTNCLMTGNNTIQCNLIAKCQNTDCMRNVLWCQVHSSHIHSNHKTFNYNNSK